MTPGGASASGGASPVPWSCGLLAVDKPTGATSHDVVDVVRRRLHQKSAGHTGTLDPGASGLLLVALGPATRFVPLWQGGEKTYRATIRFGLVTDTQDTHGEVLEQSDRVPDEVSVRAAALEFAGAIEQVPPMVSALRVGGQRLYRLHRRGQVVERAPRPIHVHSWEWERFDLPEATFLVRCSGGTYVRTLAHDLGQRLGVGAALAGLRRLRSEPFGLERSTSLSELMTGPPEAAWAAGGRTLEEACAHLPRLRLDPAEVEDLGFGRRFGLPAERAQEAPVGAGPRSIVIEDETGRVLGLGGLEPESDGRLRLCPHVLMPWAVRVGRATEEASER